MSTLDELERLIARWRGPLVGLLSARGLDAQTASELAQDVFAEAWMGRARFRGDADDDAAVGRWLAGIARNLQRAHARRPRALPLEDAGDPAAETTMPDDSGAMVRAAIERLPDNEREVVRMFYLEETTTRQVAALLCLTERAVEGLLRRARKRLSGWLSLETAVVSSDKAGTPA